MIEGRIVRTIERANNPSFNHSFLRSLFNRSFGRSVFIFKHNNIRKYFKKPNVRGALVGDVSFLIFSSFRRWAPGEPSFFAKNRKEDCVAIHADPDWGKWSVESCAMETPFACKTKRKYKMPGAE